ncbi:MAG: MarR family transcriptional regulator [Elusimicrobiota bacterium]|jgi:DNA-binding MarR family transcriptional regulator
MKPRRLTINPSQPVSDPLLPRGLMARIGYLLNRPALQIRQRAQGILSPMGLIPPHVAVLSTLHTEGPLTQRALGQWLKIDPTTMVWLIDALEKKGVVRRDAHPQDRRAYLIKLTPSGEALFRQANKQLDQMDKEFLAPLSKNEQGDLRRLLIKLFRNLTTQGFK